MRSEALGPEERLGLGQLVIDVLLGLLGVLGGVLHQTGCGLLRALTDLRCCVTCGHEDTRGFLMNGVEPLMKDIKAPTLVLYGSADLLTDPSMLSVWRAGLADFRGEVLDGRVAYAEELGRLGEFLKVVILSRPVVGESLEPIVRRLAPQAKIIYDTVDLHYVREARRAELEEDKSRKEKRSAERVKLKHEVEQVFTVTLDNASKPELEPRKEKKDDKK